MGGYFLLQQSTLAAPQYLYDRILTRIGQEERKPAPFPFTRALAPYLPPDLARGWRGALIPGLNFLSLKAERPKGVGFYLVHMAAGKQFPEHRHRGMEEVLVLAGGFQDDGEQMEVGDWATMAAATQHAPKALADEDCWLGVRTEAGIRFQGWRGLIQRLLRSRPGA